MRHERWNAADRVWWDRHLSRRAALAVLAAGTVTTALGGCRSSGRDAATGDQRAGSVDFAARFAVFEPADEPNGNPAKVTWPDWLDEFDSEVRRLYEFQVVNGDLMRWMPCFCGCHAQGAPGDGHRNNRDCYIEAVNPDGSVIFDSMAPT